MSKSTLIEKPLYSWQEGFVDDAGNKSVIISQSVERVASVRKPSSPTSSPIQEKPQRQTERMAEIFDVKRFQQFAEENYFARYRFFPPLQRLLLRRKCREILSAYLIKNGFHPNGEYFETFYLNTETEEILAFDHLMVEGFLLPENKRLVLDFIKAAGCNFNDWIEDKNPSLTDLINRKTRVDQTAAFDIFRVGENSLTFRGHPDYAATGTVKITNNPFIKDPAATGSGILVVNLQSIPNLNKFAGSYDYLLSEIENKGISKLKALGVENELVIFKNCRSTDMPYPVYFFDGNEFHSSFHRKKKKEIDI